MELLSDDSDVQAEAFLAVGRVAFDSCFPLRVVVQERLASGAMDDELGDYFVFEFVPQACDVLAVELPAALAVVRAQAGHLVEPAKLIHGSLPVDFSLDEVTVTERLDLGVPHELDIGGVAFCVVVLLHRIN